MLISAPIFLYLDIEPCFTARTHHGVFSLFPRQAKVVFAGRTLLVNVGLSVSIHTLLQLEKLLRLGGVFDELLVFLLSFVNIS